MYDRIFTIFAAAVAAAAVAFYAPPAKPTPAPIPTIPVAAAAPITKCDCSGPANCLCTACKCLECAKPKVEPIPAPPAVKAAPIAAPKYTQPQPAKAVVTSPSHPHHITATHVLRWQPSYGPFGRERGGQWVRVPVNQARQYRAPQPTYRTYRSCANGSCR